MSNFILKVFLEALENLGWTKLVPKFKYYPAPTAIFKDFKGLEYLFQNSRSFQGHIFHFTRTPFSAKKNLESMSFLVLSQHEQFYPEGLSVFVPFKHVTNWVG